MLELLGDELAKATVSLRYLVSSVANDDISSFAFCALLPIKQGALPDNSHSG